MPAAVEESYADLKTRLARVVDLSRIGRVISWDQQVMMPPGGSQPRAEQLATLGRTIQEEFISDEVG